MSWDRIVSNVYGVTHRYFVDNVVVGEVFKRGDKCWVIQKPHHVFRTLKEAKLYTERKRLMEEWGITND